MMVNDHLETILKLLVPAIALWAVFLQLRAANKKPFLEKQLEICIEASDIASRLATETDPDEWKKARVAFWRLYWGRLSIVEDHIVQSQMVKFGKALPEGDIAGESLPVTALRNPSFHLAHAIRNLIFRSWGIKLKPLIDGRKAPSL